MTLRLRSGFGRCGTTPMRRRTAAGSVLTFAPAAGETITPGEYLVTLPLAIARSFGLTADVEGASGFIAATPGDDDGNKPNTVRVLTVRPDNTFGPNPFRLVLRTV